jgi:hypothetical protein
MKTPMLAAVALLLAGLSISSPVMSGVPFEPRVELRSAATVQPDANGFFTLGEIAAVTGGDASMRARLNAVPVGRVPFDYSRCINLGDVALKLREAGFDPEHGLVLAGSPTTMVSGTQTGTALPASSTVAPTSPSLGDRSQASAQVQASDIVIHRGDPVTIVIEDDFMTVTASGQSRDNGAVGDTILVHRPGVMTDISVEVLDAHTVRMEM